jgi:glucosamine 6-phosphate synthetase-like amidotransferase/phosphosugar isomerase protein
MACRISWLSIEEFARISVEVEYASEFRYRNPIINSNDVVLYLNLEKRLIQWLLLN